MRQRRGVRRVLHRRLVAALTPILLLTAGCTQTPERDLPDVDVDAGLGASPSAPSASTGGEVPTTAGRLAVVDAAGNLITVRPDGSNVVVLAEIDPGASLVRQPTWSPDGKRVAWVRLEGQDADLSSFLVTTGPEGGGPTEAAMPTAPFYLFWDPTSSRIAYLGSAGPEEIELGIVDVAGGGTEVTPIGAGQPFYLSWAPSGEQMLIHVNDDRLDRLGLDGKRTPLGERPGTFRAPAWTADGRSLVYAAAVGGGQRLLAHDLDERRPAELLRFEGSIGFVVSPDGGRVAYQVTDEAGAPGPLSVVDRATGEVAEVTDEFSPGFFWSPEGDRLLFLVTELAGDRVWGRWGVWEDGASFTTPRFSPSIEFARDYLPFFDQYAQSTSLWSPDGRAFAYPGANEAGQEGIWIQPAEPDAEPVLVGDGVYVTWSPR